MRIQSLLLIITVFLVFTSFTSAECCLGTTGLCIDQDPSCEEGTSIGSSDVCQDSALCQTGCCTVADEIKYYASQFFCIQEDGTFNSAITGEAACTEPTIETCCIISEEYNQWITNLACFNAGGEGSELNETECTVQTQTLYTISGTVYDDTNQQVENVQLLITDGITTTSISTNSEGTYSYTYAEDETSYWLSIDYQTCTASDSVTISGSDVEVNLTLDCTTLGCSELSAESGYSDSTCCLSGETGTLEGISGVALQAQCTDLNQQCWGNANICEVIIYEEVNSCLSEDSQINLSTSEIEGQRAVNLNWIVEDCENGEFDIIRCVTSLEAECNPFEGANYITTERITATNYPDYIIGEGTNNYCYGVIGYFNSDEYTTTINSNYDCFSFEERQCEIAGQSSCTSSTTLDLCTDSYDIEETTCDTGNICVDNYETNTASCVEQAECGLCNGPLGIFLNDHHQVDDIKCNELETCFIDYAPVVVDNYRECLEINTCYDYRSKNACEGEYVMDTCNRGPCQWMETSTEELGLGVCRPIQEIKQDCSKCDSMTYNNLFGTCNEERCSMMGKCFLGDNECKNLNNLNCNYFTQDACINSANYWSLNGSTQLNQSVQLSVTYTSNENGELDVRTGGTHEVLISADSHFGSLPGFNLCRWFGENIGCGKDADGDFNPDNTASDMTPPVTHLILVNEDNILLPTELNIPIIIIDNLQTSGFKTYFSYTKEQQYQEDDNASQEYYYDSVYPTIQVENNLITTEEINESGNYRIKYYTEDIANNLEIVKYIDVVVDIELIMPNITWSYTTTNNANSTLIITLEVFEKVLCTDKLYKDDNGDFGEIIAENLHMTELIQENYHLITQVPDGSYYYYLECQDTVGNTNSKTEGIGINAPIPITITIE